MTIIKRFIFIQIMLLVLFSCANKKERRPYVPTTEPEAVVKAIELLNNGDATGAVAYIDSVTKVLPQSEVDSLSRDFCMVKAYALSGLDSIQEARELINRGLAITPRSEQHENLFRDYAYAAAVFFNDTMAEQKVANWCQVAIEHAKACEHDPGSAFVITMLGDLYDRQGKPHEVISLYDEAIRESRTPEATIMSSLGAGRMYARYGVFENADNYATIAIQQVEKNKIVHPVILGEVYNLKGKCMISLDPKKAIQYFEKGSNALRNMPYGLGQDDIDLNMALYYIIARPDSIEKARELLKRRAEKTEVPQKREQSLDLLAKLEAGEEIRLADEGDMVIGKLASSLMDQQNRLHALEIEKNKAERKNLLMRIWVISLSAVVLLIVAIWIILYRQRRYKETKARLENEQSELQKRLDNAILAESLKQAQIDEILATLNNRHVIENLSPSLINEVGEAKFRERFDALYPGMINKAKDMATGQLSQREILLIMLLVLRVDSPRIAQILSITPESVNKARYRLRRRFNVEKGESLDDLLLSLIK